MTPKPATDLTQLELAEERTHLAFQRTRLGAERTLMAIMRTALALIGFGFTTWTFLHLRSLSLGLVFIGMALQALGMWKHIDFTIDQHRERQKFGPNIAGAERGRLANHVVFVVAALMMGLGLAVGAWVAIQAA